MALNKMVKKLNLESEEIDVSEVEDQTIEDVVEADVNASELQDATKELEEVQEDFKDGEATAAELQEAIDHTKEVIAQAEKASEEGKEAEVPVEEIVAAQESLKYFYEHIGFDSSNMVTVSREDIATGSLEAYKNLSANLEQLQVNLEGILSDIGSKLKEKIKNAGNKLMALLGSKKAASVELLKTLNAIDGEISPEANAAFVNKNKKLGYNAEIYSNGIIPVANEIYAVYSKLFSSIIANKPFTSKDVKPSKYAKYVQGVDGVVAAVYPAANGALAYTFVDANGIIDEDEISSKELKDIKLNKATAIKLVSGALKESDVVDDLFEKLDKLANGAEESGNKKANYVTDTYMSCYTAVSEVIDANFKFVNTYALATIKALKASK